jgi:tRNA pseudouridine38-40 synthase
VATFRIDLAYDGTAFRGWARNTGVRTVQGEVERALATVLRADVAVSVAGRTDAGVHARHQVASFATESVVDVVAAVRSLRTMLAPEVSIHGLQPVADDFDARFSAVRRSYRYFIDEASHHDPLAARWVWHLGETLDVEAMNRAAAAFVGSHDFASLCRAAEGGTTERTVEHARWERGDHPDTRYPIPDSRCGGEAGLLVFSVAAKAFCHQMVRSMVALCVDVGRGRVPAETVPGILEQRDRNAARGVAPPHGLVLWEVEY